MASGISGAGPDTHDSETTLSKLLPGVAAYRDAFYEQLIGRLAEEDQRACGTAAGRSPSAATALWRCPSAPERSTDPLPGLPIGTRPPGNSLRPHGLSRCGATTARGRPRGLGPHALPNRLPPDPRPAGDGPTTAASWPSQRLLEARRDPAAGDRVWSGDRSLEHPGIRRQLQPVPGDGEQHPRSSCGRADRGHRRDLRYVQPALEHRRGGRPRGDLARRGPATGRSVRLVAPVRGA